MTVPVPGLSGGMGTFAYDYDDLGRMTSLVNPLNDETDWTYFPNDWLSSQYDYDGGSASGLLVDKDSYSYLSDARGLVSRLFDANMSGGHMAEYGNTSSPSTPMTYDAAGNRLSMLVSEPAYGGYGGTTNYSYDYKDELTTEATTRNGNKTTNYAYDLAGNNTPGQVNSDNEFSDTGYTYDGNGNPTSYYGHPATYDAENRLTSFGGNGGGSSGMAAGYGLDGLRIWRTQGGSTTYYVYDGDVPVVELSSAGALVALNTWGADGLISRSTGTAATAKHFYSFDPEGSPSVIYDGTGAQVAAADTSAFGTLTYTGNFNSDPYAGFGSQWGYYTDWGTGLELLGHRYYDPNAGRFINRDPTGYAGGSNLYDYVDNDPTVWADPDGFVRGRTIGKELIEPIKKGIREGRLDPRVLPEYNNNPEYRQNIRDSIHDRKFSNGKTRSPDLNQEELEECIRENPLPAETSDTNPVTENQPPIPARPEDSDTDTDGPPNEPEFSPAQSTTVVVVAIVVIVAVIAAPEVAVPVIVAAGG